MKEKLREFLATELNYIKVGFEDQPAMVKRSDIAWYGIQRGLGASEFAQKCGLSYEDAEQLFEEYKMKIHEMEDKYNEMC